MAGKPRLRDADELILPSVRRALAGLDLTDSDAAAARLAESYARLIDATPPEEQVEVLASLGPKLLSALTALAATPAARAHLKGGGPGTPKSRLEQLRNSRGA